MTGRHMLYLFLNHWKSRGELNSGARSEQVYNLVYPGDDKLFEFFWNRRRLIEDSDQSLDETVLRRLLFQKIQHSKKLEFKLNQFKELEYDDPKFTHQALLEIIEKQIDRERDDKMDRMYNTAIGAAYGSNVNPKGAGARC